MGLLIAIGGAMWATFARIPLSVEGTGVLLPVSTINSSISGTNGNVVWMFNQPKQQWHLSARRFQNRPDQFNNRQMTELAKKILIAIDKISEKISIAQNSSAENFTDKLNQSFHGEKIPAGKLMLWIQSSVQHEQLHSQLDQLKRTLRDTLAQQNNINSKQSILRQELARRSSYLAQMQSLESKGYVTRATILQEQAQVDNLRTQIYSNKNELIQLANQLDQSYQKLGNTLSNLINQEMIFASHDVYLTQVIPNNGESVSKGQVVLQLSDDSLKGPRLVPVFLGSKEMAQVFPGMDALATPEGYKRSEVGGIRGRVVSMAQVPSGLEDVSARVGLKSLAQVITNREPSPTLAVVALERTGKTSPFNSGGYRWSSKGDLPFPPTPGDRLSVQITTRHVAPIEMVLPSVRYFFGMSPPDSPNQLTSDNKQKINE
ncbi:hypothetical protein HI855_10425 [Cyanobacteria bacterium 150NLHA]|nr:hypothetical protein PMIT1327_02406 [Prochlorococcus marinus str. MIT 1327]NMO83978.1 hypothetical protein [Prochlorococcus sp. P1344]NMP06969.1 hypothetical protein [Prochlorococcus sp. P1361]NMP12812.1 hypothetical protein [Prochlorococcus sp.P1363]